MRARRPAAINRAVSCRRAPREDEFDLTDQGEFDGVPGALVT